VVKLVVNQTRFESFKTHTRQKRFHMPAIAVTLTFFISVAVGIEVFVAVFFAPVVIYDNLSILLAWGWIAPAIGLPVGVLFAWPCRLTTHPFGMHSAAAELTRETAESTPHASPMFLSWYGGSYEHDCEVARN
jgi:hypothetical protein